MFGDRRRPWVGVQRHQVVERLSREYVYGNVLLPRVKVKGAMRVPLRRRGRIQVYVSSLWILGDYATSLFGSQVFDRSRDGVESVGGSDSHPSVAYVSNWVTQRHESGLASSISCPTSAAERSTGLFVSVAAEFQARTGRGCHQRDLLRHGRQHMGHEQVPSPSRCRHIERSSNILRSPIANCVAQPNCRSRYSLGLRQF